MLTDSGFRICATNEISDKRKESNPINELTKPTFMGGGGDRREDFYFENQNQVNVMETMYQQTTTESCELLELVYSH